MEDKNVLLEEEGIETEEVAAEETPEVKMIPISIEHDKKPYVFQYPEGVNLEVVKHVLLNLRDHVTVVNFVEINNAKQKEAEGVGNAKQKEAEKKEPSDNVN